MTADYNAHYNWLYMEFSPSYAKLHTKRVNRHRDEDDFFEEEEYEDYEY